MLCDLYFYRARIISRSCNFYVNSREQQSLKSVFTCGSASKCEVEKEILPLQLKNYTNIPLGVLVLLNLYGGIDLEMESLSVLQWGTQQKFPS